MRSSGWRSKAGSDSTNERRHPGVCASGSCFLAHRFVHLELDVALEAEQLVLARGGQGLGAVRQEEEVVEEEGPQLPGAFGLVEAAAVQQPARPEAAGQRVEDQALKSEYKVVMCGKTRRKAKTKKKPKHPRLK